MWSTAIFIGMIAIAVFALMLGLTIPVFGENRAHRRQIQQKLSALSQNTQTQVHSLVRLRRTEILTPLGRFFEKRPIFEFIRNYIEASGKRTSVLEILFQCLVLALIAGISIFVFTKIFILSLFAAAAVSVIPVFNLIRIQNKRMALFEEQLPEAIDMMRRSLQAGYPLIDTFKIIAEEMESPIAEEFALTFADINYGADIQAALYTLLSRVPSVTLKGLVMAILIQRETGGNLIEVLESASRLIRERFSFNRKVKTLTAEGRMSAWVLCAVPFVLIIFISITTPGYLGDLIGTDTGKKVVAYAFGIMILGVFWMRRIIRVEV
ncbi:MAG: type II secretion system F family protein [Pseudomonadota bacterium]